MPNEACFLYVCSGEQRLSSVTHQTQLKQRDAVLMKCGIYFGEWLTSTQYDTCEAIAIHLYPEVLKKIYAYEIPDFISKFRRVNNLNSISAIDNNVLIDQYIRSMQFYFENPHLVDDDLIKLKLRELILLLVKTEKAVSIMEVISSLFSPIEYSFREVIEANIFSDHSIEELAQLTNLSPSTFKREFLKVYGDSPARYIKRRKIEHASELLKISTLRIKEVAAQCGFDDPAHFTRTFHSIYKISPTDFRLSQKVKSLS